MRVVPNTPLLWLVALAVIPATTMLVFFPAGAGRWAALLILAVVLAVAAVDMARSQGRLDELEVESPGLQRVTRGKECSLPLKFKNLGDETLPWLRFGLAVLPEFRVVGAVIREIAELPGQKAYPTSCELIPLKRGQYFFDDLFVEAPSHLGLWLTRRRYAIDVEFRVYPDLSSERRRLSGIFLHRGNEGGHAVRQVGKGREFEQLREYQHGDDYVDIDWKATARRGQPVTRTYQIERTQEVYVIVDHSRLSAREIRTPIDDPEESMAELSEYAEGGEFAITTQLERFLHCSLILSSVAERQGDLFGFISFADRVDRFIRSRSGANHYNIVRDALYTLEPKMVAPDFEQLMITLRQRLTRRALLVMLVDLSDPLTAEQFYESIPLISRQHLILVNMVRPEKAHPLFSPRREPESAAAIYENLGGHFQWSELGEIARKLGHLGVDLGLPEHEELCADTVTQYLNVKKRQLI
ncbi:MAG: DUF58 domain-containing protein [Verrucomicrobiae bacterium]|nr:DUF58 domain-containing protein [Verrucomicrobiae bacterium]